MDWPNLIAYVAVLFNIVVLGWRVSNVQAALRRVDAKVSWLTFVRIQELEGKSPGEVTDLLNKMGKAAREELAFAEIAQRVRRPWWHWKTLTRR